MAHERPRYLETSLRKILAFSPLVGVLGHRQVGKTTLLGQLCRSYHSLDSQAEFDAALEDPERYLHDRAGTWG